MTVQDMFESVVGREEDGVLTLNCTDKSNIAVFK